MACRLCKNIVFANLHSLVESHPKSYPSVCSMRWYIKRRRKPLHIPVAPSKLYRIIERQSGPEDEVNLRIDLSLEYVRKMQSLRKMFYNEYLKTSDTSVAAAIAAGEEEKNHKRLLEENDKENERIRLIREETLEKEFEEQQIFILQHVEQMKKEREEQKEKADEIVKKISEEAANYITYETLEQAIEHAMDRPVCYEFCIDLNGQIYWEEGTQGKDYDEFFRSRA